MKAATTSFLAHVAVTILPPKAEAIGITTGLNPRLVPVGSPSGMTPSDCPAGARPPPGCRAAWAQGRGAWYDDSGRRVGKGSGQAVRMTSDATQPRHLPGQITAIAWIYAVYGLAVFIACLAGAQIGPVHLSFVDAFAPRRAPSNAAPGTPDPAPERDRRLSLRGQVNVAGFRGHRRADSQSVRAPFRSGSTDP